MPRIARKKIKFTEESLNELYQECYNDSYNYRATINNFLSKWSILVKDEGNIAAMGKEIVALLNALGKTNEQKIVLLKVLKDILNDKSDREPEVPNVADAEETMSDEARQSLLKMAEDYRKNKIKNENKAN